MCSHLSATTFMAHDGLGKHYLVPILQMRSYQRALEIQSLHILQM